MTPVRDPMVQRRRLRAELRRARDDAGFTQRQVAEAMDWSSSKVIRIESGSVGISTSDLRALLQHYGIDDDSAVNRFIEMARASRETPWWSAYKESTPPPLQTLLGYESSASAIYQFHPLLVPGLLQEEEYVRAILRTSANPPASDQEMNQRVELRLRRQQELFERADPPKMFFVLDEAVLHRMVGGPHAMHRQIARLRELTARDHVTIEVVPFSAGAYQRLGGPYMILEFPDYDDDILYLENPSGGLVNREDQDEIASYRQTFEYLRTLVTKTDFETMFDNVLAETSEPPT